MIYIFPLFDVVYTCCMLTKSCILRGMLTRSCVLYSMEQGLQVIYVLTLIFPDIPRERASFHRSVVLSVA